MTTIIDMPSPPISTRSSSVSEDSEEEFGLTSYRKDIYGYPSLLSPASTRSSYTEEDMCTCKPSDVCASCRLVDDITEPMSPRKKLMSPRKKALSDPTPLARKTMNRLQQKLNESMSPDALTRRDNPECKEIDSTLVSMIAENLPTWVVPARDPKGKPIGVSLAHNNHQINYLTDIPHVPVPNGTNQGSTGTICNQQALLHGNHSRLDNWQEIKNKFKAAEHQYTKFESPLHFNSPKIPQPPSEYVDIPVRSPTESLDLSCNFFYPVAHNSQNIVDAAANATYKAPYSQRWQNGSQSDSTPTPSDKQPISNDVPSMWSSRTTSDLSAKQHPTCNAVPLPMPSKPFVDTWTTPFVTCRDDNNRIPPMQPLNAPQPNSQPSMAKSRRGSNLGNNATQRGHIRDDAGKNYQINNAPMTDKKNINTVENNVVINVARNKIIQDKSSAEIEKEQKKATLYKTEMCRNWEEKGDCRYGVKCQFAHSSTELREVKKHPKYKTEICKTFWEKGACPYGRRCCFIHNEKNLMPHSSNASLRAFTDAYFSGNGIQECGRRRRLPCFTNLTR
ncbi:9079_t:CDS:2 [Paraglomus brasilianum]|uniref:9079_t:CDS:1 n=1 Tax=Paraglomus brasilianum TaxID=144538 RepID=A0A9N8VV69_9GLOM|nr:9079_t:CDS:2 [Paraglomus brasilianum]